MAYSTRTTLIAKAIKKAGRMGELIDLTREFDEVTQFISRQFPILKSSTTGVTVEDQGYISLPSDYACRRFLIVDQNPLTWCEPDPLLVYINSNTLTSGLPSSWTIVDEEGRIYIVAPPDDAYTYYFAYGRIHPRSGKKLAFTSGGTYQIVVGNWVGVTGSATTNYGRVEDVILTSGTWAAGTAAGSLIISDDVGTFGSSGTLDTVVNGVVVETNAATYAAAIGSADDYQHLYSYDFEEAILELLTAKCCESIEELAPKAIFWQTKGMRDLRLKFAKKMQSYNAPRTTYWNPSWSVK